MFAFMMVDKMLLWTKMSQWVVVDENVTTSCFLDVYKITFEPRWNTYPEVVIKTTYKITVSISNQKIIIGVGT